MTVFATAPARTTVQRLPRLVIGLILCGIGIALMINANLGLAPWDVLHQGISKRTGVSIGTVGIAVGFAVLLLWLPLKERLGVGTLVNVVLIGLTINVVLPLLPDDPSIGVRWAFLIVGAALLGPGGGLYIGAGLGAGPRDGLMTSLAERGWSIRLVRTVMELTVLALGWVLGGSVGIGTLLFALTIGPNVHWCLERMSLEPVGVVHPGPVIEVE
jgi:uncharacterized membrane protein YczE